MNADDIALVGENGTALQTMLDTLFNWCCKWHLMINNSKSAIVHFRKTKKGCTKSEFNIGSKSVKTVSQYKYLGLTLDENLNFDACAQTFCRALAKLISKFKCQKNLSYQTFTKLFDTCVWPILDYCSSIWKNILIEFKIEPYVTTLVYIVMPQHWDIRQIWAGFYQNIGIISPALDFGTGYAVIK